MVNIDVWLSAEEWSVNFTGRVYAHLQVIVFRSWIGPYAEFNGMIYLQICNKVVDVLNPALRLNGPLSLSYYKQSVSLQ